MSAEKSKSDNDQSILDNGIRICQYYYANPDYIRTGSLIPGLILVYWQIKKETGTMREQPNKEEYWKRAKELRPGATREQQIDTAIALFVYEKVTGERL